MARFGCSVRAGHYKPALHAGVVGALLVIYLVPFGAQNLDRLCHETRVELSVPSFLLSAFLSKRN